MNLFLSWSGARSHLAAKAFERCLPLIFDRLEIYLSSSMNKGVRWNPPLNKALEEADFGVLCVTKENHSAPWMIYEAGLLSRTAGADRVAPFLLDIDHKQLSGEPLSEFQATVFEKEDLWKLIATINQCHGERERISGATLPERFEVIYETRLKKLLNQALAFRDSDEDGTEDMARKTLAGVERLLNASKANQRLLEDIIFDMKERSQ